MGLKKKKEMNPRGKHFLTLGIEFYMAIVGIVCIVTGCIYLIPPAALTGLFILAAVWWYHVHHKKSQQNQKAKNDDEEASKW